jgi:hypothetical protein
VPHLGRQIVATHIYKPMRCAVSSCISSRAIRASVTVDFDFMSARGARERHSSLPITLCVVGDWTGPARWLFQGRSVTRNDTSHLLGHHKREFDAVVGKGEQPPWSRKAGHSAAHRN